MRQSAEERQEAIERLRVWIKPGDTIYTILRHVSRSGMQREISMKVCRESDIGDLDWNAATAMGDRIGKHDGIVVGGCGMDMGFHLVYTLSRTLWPNGYGCIGEGCRSNDHSNGDRDYTEHGRVNCPPKCGHKEHPVKHWHTDGGYALRQQWL